MTRPAANGPVGIRPLAPADGDEIAPLDVAARTTAALGVLGPRFYARLYGAMLRDSDTLGFGAHADGRLVGFVIGVLDAPRALRRALRRSFPSLAATALVAVARRPAVLPRLISALRYPARTSGPELIVISVAAAWQRRGVARALVGTLDEAFRAAGVDAYRVSTKVATRPAVRFYERLAYVQVEAFELLGEPWLVFERRPGSREPVP